MASPQNAIINNVMEEMQRRKNLADAVNAQKTHLPSMYDLIGNDPLKQRWYGPAIPPNYDTRRLPGYVGDPEPIGGPPETPRPQDWRDLAGRDTRDLAKIVGAIQGGPEGMFQEGLPFPAIVDINAQSFPRIFNNILDRVSSLPSNLTPDEEKANIAMHIFDELEINPNLANKLDIKLGGPHQTGGGALAAYTNPYDPASFTHPFDPSKLQLLYDPTTGKPINRITLYQLEKQSTPDLVSALGHEAEHANQYNLDPTGFTSYIPGGPIGEGELANQFRARQGEGPMPGHLTYRGQYWERGAHDYGKVVDNIMKQFQSELSDLVGGGYDVNQSVRNMPDFVRDVIMPAYADRSRMITQAMQSTANSDPEVMAHLVRGKNALDTDILHLGNYLNPVNAHIVDPRNELTGAHIIPKLDQLVPPHPDMPQGAVRNNARYGFINPYLRNFLLDRQKSATGPLQFPGPGGTGLIHEPGVHVDISDVIRAILGRPIP